MFQSILRSIKYSIPLVCAGLGLGVHIIFWAIVGLRCHMQPASCGDAYSIAAVVDFPAIWLVQVFAPGVRDMSLYDQFTVYFVFGAFEWLLIGLCIGILINRAVKKWIQKRFAKYIKKAL